MQPMGKAPDASPADVDGGGVRDTDARTERQSSGDGKRRRAPKKRVAALVAYCGLGYQGMQINPDCNSVELHLRYAFLKADAIMPDNAEKLQKVGWQRCARTDKGVHATGQVISFKMQMVDPDTMTERVNSFLPDDIRIFGITTTTGSFNAKNMCGWREYEYLLPTVALRPSSVHPQHGDEWTFDHRVKEKVNRLLAAYVGTHNFHNFTKGSSWSDPAAKRFVMAFSCSDPVEMEGVQFVRLTVRGQSFMFHQIRKMVAMMALIVRDGAPEELLEACMGPTDVNIPLVPGTNLMLRSCDFSIYEQGRGKNSPPIRFPETEAAREEFVKQQIILPLAKMQRDDKIMEEWLEYQEDKRLDYDKIIAEHKASLHTFGKKSEASGE